MHRLLYVILVTALSCCAFCMGGYISQRTSEAKAATEVQYTEMPPEIVEKEVEVIKEVLVEVEVIKEVPIELKNWGSFHELYM